MYWDQKPKAESYFSGPQGSWNVHLYMYVVYIWKWSSAHALGASVVWHHWLLLMNSFNKTEAAVFSCRLCFLRAFPFIILDKTVANTCEVKYDSKYDNLYNKYSGLSYHVYIFIQKNNLKRNPSPDSLDTFRFLENDAKRVFYPVKTQNWKEFCDSITKSHLDPGASVPRVLVSLSHKYVVATQCQSSMNLDPFKEVIVSRIYLDDHSF